ncbi:MAG: adenosylhomocysteinase, partial [bacterium]
MDFDIKDKGLAGKGALRMEWAGQSMPVLYKIQERFRKEKPLEGVRIGACLHVTSETAVLMQTLAAGGAEVRLCASNPLSTQDDVAATLVENENIPTFAIKGEDRDTYFRHLKAVLDGKPNITMDDGADLVTEILTKRKELIPGIIGSTEETTTGVIRLRAMENEGVLTFPVVAVNDAETKHLF